MNITAFKQHTRIEQVIQQSVPLRAKGRIWVGRCPFHHDQGRPNLVVFPATQTWTCFVCGIQGDVLDWLQRWEGRSLAAILQDPGIGSIGAQPPPFRSAARNPWHQSSPDRRDEVYRAWLTHQSLTPLHAESLRARGLTSATIRRQQLCSYTPGPLPDGLSGAGVPGFAWVRHRWESVAPAGLWIPIRDVEQRIVGAQIRTDATDTGKYRWFSSARFPQGTPTVALVHVELGPGTTVWITEGPLKAMRLHQHFQVPVLGLPGASTWRKALPLLAQLQPRSVIIALDQHDILPTVRAAMRTITLALGQACQTAGYTVGYARWDIAKGIDDALQQGQSLRITPCLPSNAEGL